MPPMNLECVQKGSVVSPNNFITRKICIRRFIPVYESVITQSGIPVWKSHILWLGGGESEIGEGDEVDAGGVGDVAKIDKIDQVAPLFTVNEHQRSGADA